MLKTSPILTNSANASPTSFRRGHVTPRSPQLSPRQSTSTSTSSARRPPSVTSSSPNATSDNSPPPHRPKQCDSATDGTLQHDNITSRRKLNHTSPSSHVQHIVTPAASGSLPSASPAQSEPPVASDAEAQKVLSPNKRRVSSSRPTHGSTSQNGGHNGEGASPSTTTAPKRARTDGEPKVLPQRYELCAVDDIVELIAHMLAELIATNDAIRISSGGLTRFHSR